MSSRAANSFDEIAQYLDRLREERRLTENSIRRLDQDKNLINDKIEELKMRRDSIESRLHEERERAERQDRGIREAEETYKKLIESQKTLVDFVRKEYQDTKRGHIEK